jgi:hypothetical protein
MLFVGRPERKKPLGRPRCRWVDYMKMDLGEYCGVVWTGMIWLRIDSNEGLLYTWNKRSGSKKCWEFLE